ELALTAFEHEQRAAAELEPHRARGAVGRSVPRGHLEAQHVSVELLAGREIAHLDRDMMHAGRTHAATLPRAGRGNVPLVRGLVGVSIAALPFSSSCSLPAPRPDGPQTGDNSDGLTPTPPLRDVTFATLPPGTFAGGMINDVTFAVAPYNGSQTIAFEDL